MDAKIKWSKTAKEIVLQVKFPKEILDFEVLKIGEAIPDSEYLSAISNRMIEFFNLIFSNGFLTTGNSTLSFGKSEIPTLKVEVVL